MNLQEEIESAFKAGAEFVSEYIDIDWHEELVDLPDTNKINKAMIEYINDSNGNKQSS